MHNLAPMSNTHEIGPANEKLRGGTGPTVCWIGGSAGSTSRRVVCRSMPLGNVKYPLVDLTRSPYTLSHAWIPSENHVASRVHASRSPLNTIPPPLSDVSPMQWVVLFNAISPPSFKSGNYRVGRKLWKSACSSVLRSHPPFPVSFRWG